MGLDVAGIGSVADLVNNVIDKIFPDKAERDKAKLQLVEMQQNGELKQIELQLSAIVAEANSQDPWTSRARPSFMYVIYALILTSLPMGVLFAISPETANDITTGFGKWLSAIPSDFITLFGVGYLGYTGARTVEKAKGGK